MRFGSSEDCLYLDVWSPAAALRAAGTCIPCPWQGPRQAAPVLVWIYGGGLLGGSKDYDNTEGRVYAERGVVFVRGNYRVGVLGWLCPEGGDANCGLWDQVELLRWVQREIGHFGGDPGRVTIMGQSAGADVCQFLVSSSLANKLFRRAILQSAGSFTVTPAQMQEMAHEFAAVAGARSSSLADLQALSADAVLSAQRGGCFRYHPSTGPGWRVMHVFGGKLREITPPDPSPAGLFRFPDGAAPRGYFFPTAVVDGELLEKPPLEALFDGVARDLDILIGCNREEDASRPTRAAVERPLPTNYGVQLPPHEGRAEVARRMAWEIAGMPKLLSASPEELLSRIEALVDAYDAERRADVFGLGPTGTVASEHQWMLDTMASDFSFVANTVNISERLALPGCAAKVFRYQFNGYDDRGDAFHAAEMEMLAGEDRCVQFGSLEVRREWLDSWAAFVSSGDPNTAAMAGVWRPFSDNDRPVLFWDGVRGWRSDGGPVIRQRTALRATAKLWEELWLLRSVVP